MCIIVTKLNVLYITGEESLNQTKLRADRLDEDSSNLNVLAETDLEVIHQTVQQAQPDILVVDSIQTIYHPEISSDTWFCVSSKRKYTEFNEYC